MAHFKNVTMAVPAPVAGNSGMKLNAVVMGRKTWESIPEKFRPLTGRVSVVLTSKASEADFVSPYPADVLVAPNVAGAVDLLSHREDVAEIFVIGGQAAYEEAMKMPACARLFVTRVAKEFPCDVFFPEYTEA